MTGGEPPVRQGDYRTARIGAATALTALLCVLFLADIFMAEYSVDAVVVTLLVTTIATLLGIEAADVIRGGRK